MRLLAALFLLVAGAALPSDTTADEMLSETNFIPFTALATLP